MLGCLGVGEDGDLKIQDFGACSKGKKWREAVVGGYLSQLPLPLEDCEGNSYPPSASAWYRKVG